MCKYVNADMRLSMWRVQESTGTIAHAYTHVTHTHAPGGHARQHIVCIAKIQPAQLAALGWL